MSVSFDKGLRVVIKDDYELVSKFLQWQLSTKIFGFRGSSSGQGCSIDWFPYEYKDEIKAFFKDQRNAR